MASDTIAGQRLQAEDEVLRVVVQRRFVERAEVPLLEPIVGVALVGHHLLGEGQQLQAPSALRAVLELLVAVVVVPILVATLAVAVPQPNGRISIPDLDVQALLLSP